MFTPKHYLTIEKIVGPDTALVTMKMTRSSKMTRLALVLVPWGLVVGALHVMLNAETEKEPLTEDTDVPFPNKS